MKGSENGYDSLCPACQSGRGYFAYSVMHDFTMRTGQAQMLHCMDASIQLPVAICTRCGGEFETAFIAPLDFLGL